MSTTTEILFNSPALHSLKRDQLVKLCKIHSIKASGKNVELIKKLRRHAKTLPKDSPLSIATRSESTVSLGAVEADASDSLKDEEDEEEDIPDDKSPRSQFSRQSEQWEMVMDVIEEEEEGSSQGTMSSRRTLNGTGEFGVGSSKSSTVGSSIKALASSFGLKRGGTKSSSASSKHSSTLAPHEDDELVLKSTPYSSLPESTSMPQTDHFTLSSNRMSVDGNEEIPLPGHALRPGEPAPANARLSLGLGLGAPSTPLRSQPTTTIRLVANQSLLPGESMDWGYDSGGGGTPQLKPFKTTFDLSFASPAPEGKGLGFGGTNIWPPPRDDEMQGLYPKLTFDDLPPSMPGSPVPTVMPTGPFVFGSPLPKNNVSDAQFKSAAASVLEEMNQRLRTDGVDEVGFDIISKLHPGAKPAPPREIKPLPFAKRTGGDVTDKFQKAHEEEFQKMESIDETLRRRTQLTQQMRGKDDGEKVAIGKKRKSSVLERDGGAGPRRPSVVAGRASTTRVISNGRRAKLTIPGGFGMDDELGDDEEEEDRGGKRVRMDPEAAAPNSEELRKQEEEAARQREELEREKQIIRKKLEANRARRRSSAANATGPRKSIGRPRPSLLQKPKPKPSRFGFLSSAKSLVQNVWNRGKVTEPTASSLAKANPPPKVEPVKEKMAPPSFVPAKKSTAAPARPTPAVATGSKPMPTNSTNASLASKAPSSRARSPLPTFNTTNSRSSNVGTGTTRTSRSSILSSNVGSLAGSATGKPRPSSVVSSLGTKASSRPSSTDAVGSMGAKKLASGASAASRKSVVGSTSRLSAASRLLAPTASSLAKANRNSLLSPSSGTNAPLQPRHQSPAPALGMITNNLPLASPRHAGMPHGTFSPRPGKIFSQPLGTSSQPPLLKKQTESRAPTSPPVGQNNKPAVRSLNGRKPRISRSKVIARLASQREATAGRVASGSSAAGGKSVLAPRPSAGGRKRSSLGVKVARASYGGGTLARTSASGPGNVLLSAKKRARQSEYARRRSRVGPMSFDTPEKSKEVAA